MYRQFIAGALIALATFPVSACCAYVDAYVVLHGQKVKFSINSEIEKVDNSYRVTLLIDPSKLVPIRLKTGNDAVVRIDNLNFCGVEQRSICIDLDTWFYDKRMGLDWKFTISSDGTSVDVADVERKLTYPYRRYRFDQQFFAWLWAEGELKKGLHEAFAALKNIGDAVSIYDFRATEEGRLLKVTLFLKGLTSIPVSHVQLNQNQRAEVGVQADVKLHMDSDATPYLESDSRIMPIAADPDGFFRLSTCPHVKINMRPLAGKIDNLDVHVKLNKKISEFISVEPIALNSTADGKFCLAPLRFSVWPTLRSFTRLSSVSLSAARNDLTMKLEGSVNLDRLSQTVFNQTVLGESAKNKPASSASMSR